MPNQNDMSQDLDFEKKIEAFSPEGKFLARQLYDVCSQMESHDERLIILENYNKKAFGLTGGLGAIIGGAVISIVSYFTQK